MSGYSNLKQNIDTSQSNFNNSIERNATDGSQALALEAAGMGITNNAYSDLQTKQQGNKVAMLGNLNDAEKGMVEEGDKSYQAMLQKYMMDVQTQNQLRGAGTQNIVGAFNDIGSKAISFGNYLNAGK
jgi:uncharacterized ferritin-like protein (DUF455 family)